MRGWKQCATLFPGDFEGIQDPFETLFTALRAPPEMALFSRTTNDLKHQIFLLTPEAAVHSPALRGDWLDAGDPTQHRWSLLVGHADAFERFGLQPPNQRR